MNKVVLVTGASRGIGRETALAFARAGYDVAISARTVEEGQQHEHSLTGSDGQPLPGSLSSVAAEIRALGRQAWCIPMDLLNSDSVLAAADQVLREAGRVDVLVNNAVYQGADLNGAFLELTPATLERMFRGYVLAPVLLTQKLLPGMLERGDGVIINVTSGAGESNPPVPAADRKSTRLNSSHVRISYAVLCLHKSPMHVAAVYPGLRPARPTLLPYATLFRSLPGADAGDPGTHVPRLRTGPGTAHSETAAGHARAWRRRDHQCHLRRR